MKVKILLLLATMFLAVSVVSVFASVVSNGNGDRVEEGNVIIDYKAGFKLEVINGTLGGDYNEAIVTTVATGKSTHFKSYWILGGIECEVVESDYLP